MELKLIDLILTLGLITAGISVVQCDCEPGWYSYFDQCYYISSQRRNYHDIENVCASRNATVWVLHSQAEWAWLGKLLEPGPRILYWTGLKLVNHHWTWIDGTPYTQAASHWYRNTEGNKNSGNLCAGMLSYKPYVGQLQQKRCGEGWGAICVRPKDMLDVCDLSNGWRYIDGRCLKFYDDMTTWSDARLTCQQNNGDLTMYKDYNQLLNLYDLITCRTTDQIAWIGLSDTVQPRTWRWINNDTMRYSRWYSYGNQILQNGSTCAAADPTNGWGWRNYRCDTRMKFICNRTVGECPTGWLTNLDRCYKPNVVDTTKKTWFDAKAYCNSLAADLLIINSDAEQQFIASTIADLHVDRAWLSFSDANRSDSLTWTDGRAATNSSNYQHWNTGFPKPNHNQFDCGIISRGSHGDARWSNGYCFNNNAFFCERLISLVTTLPTPAPATTHCDPFWKPFNNKCYYFGPQGHQKYKSWFDASDYCQGSGNNVFNSNLVVINDAYEMSFITVQQASNKISWIGLRYDTKQHQLVWSDGTAPGISNVNETNFYPGEPDDLNNGQECIRIVGGRRDYTGAWDDGNCSVAQGFICEKDSYPGAMALPSTTPAPGSFSVQCGPQWVFDSNDNYCYQVVLNNPRTWADARADCISKGGDLLSISGKNEQNFVQAILRTGIYAAVQINFWIGATDQSREGGWHWTDNSPFRYLNWHPSEPNNRILGSTPEDCAEMVPSWNYQWNDKYCSKEQIYICKKTAQQPAGSSLIPPSSVPLTVSCSGVPLISGNYSVVDTQAFSASSSRDAQHLPTNSRWYIGSTGAWSSKTNDANQFISITFLNTVVVKGITTAGRTNVDQWVTSYKIMFQEKYYASWITYQNPPGTDKVFTGNNDSSSAATNMLFFPFEAKVVKLVPVQWHYGISLRWEILGCVEESCDPDYAMSGPLIVRDNSIQASVSPFDIAHDAPSSRLQQINPNIKPSCWKPVTSNANVYLQVDLGNVLVIRGATIRGNPTNQEWVTSYKIQYNIAGTNSAFKFYEEPYNHAKTIPGNTDNVSPATYYFKSNFQARFIRIRPVSWHTHIALAFDILVCQNGCRGIALIAGTSPVTDDQMNASSVLDAWHGAYRARLNQPSQYGYAGAWIPKYMDTHQYLQVDLGYMIQVTAVATQGASDSKDWVLTYQLSYSEDAVSWASYFESGTRPRVFDGNWENTIVRKNYLLLPVVARFVRLWPKTFNHRIAVRWELYGCPALSLITKAIHIPRVTVNWETFWSGCSHTGSSCKTVHRYLNDTTLLRSASVVEGSDSGIKIGCFADDQHDHDLSFEPFTDPKVGMWPPMCIHHCFTHGYYYAGIQGGYKCYCGNSYGRYGPATDCNLSCLPRTQFLCGGPSSNQVYSTGLTPQYKVCPKNWKAYRNVCYILLLDRKSWFDARAACQMVGGDLASPNSQQQHDFVYSILQYGSGNASWVGLNDIQDENIYVWADGRQVKYTNWGLGQPSHTLNAQQDCVLMNTTTGGWQDAACDSRNQYVCQMDKRSSLAPSKSTPIAGCPDGWDGYRWSCYLYADAPRTWMQGKSTCAVLGGDLVGIRDRYEQAYLSSVLGGRHSQYWVNINDQQTPGQFQSSSGLLQFTNWAQNKPDATTQCVSMGSGMVAGLWYNQNCTAQVGAVCEKPRIGYTRPIPVKPTVPQTPCGMGFIQTNHSCFQVNVRTPNVQLNWQEALEDCTSKGANLASFHDPSDLDAAWRFGLVGHSSGFWIGLNDRATENGYVWTDRTSAQYFNWKPNEPNNFKGREDCVEMSPLTSKWNDEFCGETRNWICMVPRGQFFKYPQAVTGPPVGPSSMCSMNPGWSYFNGSCYYSNDGQGDQARSWREARTYCQMHGGDLASLTSYTEQLFVYRTLLVNSTARAVWLGLNELDTNMGYRWSDQNQVKFLHWDRNEPNDFGGGEDCVMMLMRTGKWNDEHCAHSYGYVCKKPLGALPTPFAPKPQFFVGYCPTGFSSVFNRCFKIFPTAVNWTTANSQCKSLGYKLASIENDVENAFLTSKLADMSVDPWIGLKKNWKNELEWINNDEVTYTNFAYGEPNGQQGEKCVQMFGFAQKAGQWNDNKCASTQAFICQTNRDPKIIIPEPIPSTCAFASDQEQFLSNCYFYVSSNYSWTAAQANCKASDSAASLVSITSPFEQAFVYLMMKKHYGTQIWTGLNDQKVSGVYHWSDGWPVTYSNWANGEPTRGPGEGCVMFNSTGRWVDTSCTATYGSICKISSGVPTLTPQPPDGFCDEGYTAFGSYCYYFGANLPRSALDASIYCRQHGASLVSIHNDTINQLLVISMTKIAHLSNSFWTSLHKSLDTGFQWLDGSPVQYTNWRSGEPSTRGWTGNDENCMEVFINDGKWNDEDCNSKRGFVCEKPKNVDSSNAHLATGQGTIVNVPTPIPNTVPIILPSQVVPTLPQKHSHQTAPTGISPGPTGGVKPPISQSTSSNTGAGTHKPVTGPPIPSAPTGGVKLPSSPGSINGQGTAMNQEATVAPKTVLSVLGMTSGALAGVIIGVVAILVMIAGVIMYWRKNTTQGERMRFGLENQGFDNKTYKYNSSSGEVAEDDTNGGISLRTMSESSS